MRFCDLAPDERRAHIKRCSEHTLLHRLVLASSSTIEGELSSHDDDTVVLWDEGDQQHILVPVSRIAAYEAVAFSSPTAAMDG